MADDDVTVVLDGEGAIVTTGSGALLALELTTIENSGLISSPDEDSNPPAFGIPLLGTTAFQSVENTGGSSSRRSSQRVFYGSMLRCGADSSLGKSQNSAGSLQLSARDGRQRRDQRRECECLSRQTSGCVWIPQAVLSASMIGQPGRSSPWHCSARSSSAFRIASSARALR